MRTYDKKSHAVDDTMLRKTITIFQGDYDIIKQYANSVNQSFSEAIRTLSVKQIQQQENEDLLSFLNNNCKFIDECEQKEIDSKNLDYTNLNGFVDRKSVV